MEIGVLSDTHITSAAEGIKFAEMILSGPFAKVEAILHAGDMVVEELESCFYPLPWYAVKGNMDSGQFSLPGKRIIQFGNWKIGIIHGWGAPEGIEDRVMSEFKTETLDVLVFGHSHLPVCKKVDSLLLMNPGSPTDHRNSPWPSVGLLTLEEAVSGQIISLGK